VIFGRLRRHLAQPPKLAVGDLARLHRQPGVVEAPPQLVQLVLLLILAQLLADHAQLLAQHVLALVRVEARLDLFLDLGPHLEHLELLPQQLGEALEPDVHVAEGEQLGLRREGEVQVRRDEVRQLAGVRDPAEHLVQLLAEIRSDVDDTGKLRVDSALEGLGAGVLDHRLGHRLVASDEPVLGGLDLEHAGALEALHHDPRGAVAQLQHADEDPQRADLVQLVGTRLHDCPLDRLRPANRLHHAQQQALVPLHHFVDELHRLRVFERERKHHVWVDDQLSERQDGQAIGGGHSTFTDCGPERRGGSLCNRTSRKPAS